MNFVGNFPNGFTTVPVYFTTADQNGAAVAPSAALVAADVNIYKDGSNVQKTSTNGLTMTSPFDTIVGLHCLLIDTSNNTGDTNWWQAGHTYSVILLPATTTVAGQLVVKEIGSFTLGLGLMPTTAGNTLDVSATGGAGIDWSNVEAPTTTVGLTGTTISTTQVVASVSGAVGSVTGAVTLNNVQGIKKNTALAKFMFTMFDTSGVPKTGLQAGLRTSGNSQANIDAAGFTNLTNIATITEIANGWYWVDFAAADLNGTNIAMRFAATGARDLDFTIHTVLA